MGQPTACTYLCGLARSVALAIFEGRILRSTLARGLVHRVKEFATTRSVLVPDLLAALHATPMPLLLCDRIRIHLVLLQAGLYLPREDTAVLVKRERGGIELA